MLAQPDNLWADLGAHSKRYFEIKVLQDGILPHHFDFMDLSLRVRNELWVIKFLMLNRILPKHAPYCTEVCVCVGVYVWGVNYFLFFMY